MTNGPWLTPITVNRDARSQHPLETPFILSISPCPDRRRQASLHLEENMPAREITPDYIADHIRRVLRDGGSAPHSEDVQQRAVFGLAGVPARVPGAVDPETQPNRINFLTHKRPLRLSLRLALRPDAR